MYNGAKRKKKIGTIRWAVVLAFIVTFFPWYHICLQWQSGIIITVMQVTMCSSGVWQFIRLWDLYVEQ